MSNIHDMFLNKYKWYSNWHKDPRHTSWHWTALVISALFFGSITSLAISSYSNSLDLTAAENNRSLAFQNASSYNKLSDSTVKLLKLSQEYENASNKTQALGQIKKAIEDRNRIIEEVAQSNPEIASVAILDEKTQNTLPEDVKNLLEKKVNLEGYLIISHEDGLEESKFEYLIETPNGKIIKIYPSNKSALANLGSEIKPKKVKVEGDLVGDLIIARNTSTTDIAGVTSSEITPTIIKKTAVIMFNWQNDTTQPLSESQARSGYFTAANSAAAYHSENSYGKVAIQGKLRADGDVFGYYTIPYNSGSGTCPDWSTVWSWGDAAISGAKANGYDMSGYDLVTFVFPKNSGCSWAGLAVAWYSSGSPVPNRNFINGASNFATWVNGHEIGHTLGPNHAGAYKCTDAAGVPAAIGTPDKCTFTEYGDPFDIMGNSGLNSHMNSAHKNIEGVLNSSNMQTVTTSGTYTIAPIESDTTAVQMIKIPRAKVGSTVYDYLYLTYRQPIGFDSNLAQYNVTQGVSIHIGECTSPYVTCNYSGASTNQHMTMMLDNTPGDNNLRNSALTVGNTFTDPNFGVTIKTLAVSSTSATVEITTSAPPCVRTNPTVTVSPTSQWTYAGYTLNYTVNVKNNNNDSCAPSTYNISGSLPIGWTQSPASVNIAPGSSANATVSVTSSAGSPAGIYGFNEIAVDSENTSYSGVGSSSYNVTVADVIPPTVLIKSPANGSVMPTKGKLDISVSASDSSGIASISIYTDGKVVKTCASTTSCTYSWSLNGKISKGTHIIRATATDKAPIPNTSETTISVIRK